MVKTTQKHHSEMPVKEIKTLLKGFLLNSPDEECCRENVVGRFEDAEIKQIIWGRTTRSIIISLSGKAEVCTFILL